MLNNIFTTDKENNTVFYKWGGIGNSSQKQARLVNLEGYKIETRDSVVSVTIIIYSIVSSLYMLKIRNVIKNYASISKDEKTWVFQNI